MDVCRRSLMVLSCMYFMLVQHIDSNGRRCVNIETIDECHSNPCLNGGTCRDAVRSFSCHCPSGFTGNRCETNIQTCYEIICENNGTFVEGADSISCDCPEGFIGGRCQTDVDDCKDDPCQNGGTCQDGINSYFCQCQEGFTGEKCETDVDDCAEIICQNDGICADGINSYSCDCEEGFTGETCETDVDHCIGVICQNGGTCEDERNSYTCRCADGFSGTLCETEENSVVPVFYRSFDTLENVILMQGTEQINFTAVVDGQINNAVSTDRTLNQWVDLGSHPEACMTQPGTCGTAGGAIRFWGNIIDCPMDKDGGVMTTLQRDRNRGFQITCSGNNIRYRLRVSNSNTFTVEVDKPASWTHIVLNFNSSVFDANSDERGFTVYHDGQIVGSASRGGGRLNGGNDRIVIGRSFTTRNERYASVKMDELMFFNRTLTEAEITMLSEA